MKKILFAALLFAGCASAVVSTYRFAGDDKLYSFEVKKEGFVAIDAILCIDGAPVDTIKNLHGITKPSDQKSFSWKNRSVVFSASLNALTGGLGYRVLINNELVAEK